MFINFFFSRGASLLVSSSVICVCIFAFTELNNFDFWRFSHSLLICRRMHRNSTYSIRVWMSNWSRYRIAFNFFFQEKNNKTNVKLPHSYRPTIDVRPYHTYIIAKQFHVWRSKDKCQRDGDSDNNSMGLNSKYYKTL